MIGTIPGAFNPVDVAREQQAQKTTPQTYIGRVPLFL